MSRRSNIPRLTDAPTADYARKPWMIGKGDGDLSFNEFLRGADGGGSYRSLMTRIPYSVMERALARFIEHSQFKKPYWGDEFPEMENFADLMQFNGVPGWGMSSPGAFGDCSSVCSIAARGMHIAQDPNEPPKWASVTWNDTGAEEAIELVTIVVSGGDAGSIGVNKISFATGEGSSVKTTAEEVNPAAISGTPWDSSRQRRGYYFTFPDFESVQPVYFLFEQPSPYLGTDCPNTSWVKRSASFPVGGEYGDTFEGIDKPRTTGCDLWVKIASASQCEVPITWDYTLSDETIIRGGTASIQVSDSIGYGPYNWTVTGTGFTLDSAQTAGLTNTLNADGTACGSALITVTPTSGACSGVPATGAVRCTTGKWVLLYSSYQDPMTEAWNGYDNVSYSSGTWTFDKTIGIHKAYETITGFAGGQPSCTSAGYPYNYQYATRVAPLDCGYYIPGDEYNLVFNNSSPFWCCRVEVLWPYGPATYYYTYSKSFAQWEWQC